MSFFFSILFYFIYFSSHVFIYFLIFFFFSTYLDRNSSHKSDGILLELILRLIFQSLVSFLKLFWLLSVGFGTQILIWRSLKLSNCDSSHRRDFDMYVDSAYSLSSSAIWYFEYGRLRFLRAIADGGKADGRWMACWRSGKKTEDKFTQKI